MKPVNRLLTGLSLITIVITIERVSPTTKVLLQPYNFLRLHEVVQIAIITTSSVVISFLLMKVLSNNFVSLRDTWGTVLGCLFIVGTYFFATGNGAHEVASFLFNQYCDTKHFSSQICGSSYFDDYYFGNIVYFAGLGLTNLALALLERRNPDSTFTSSDRRATLANAVVLALTFIAYDAFDRVWVGLVSTSIFSVVFGGLLLKRTSLPGSRPFTLYSAVGFTLAAVVSLPLRLAI